MPYTTDKYTGRKFAVLLLNKDGTITRYVKKHSTHSKPIEWAWGYIAATQMTRRFNADLSGSDTFRVLTHETTDADTCPQDVTLHNNEGIVPFVHP